MIPPGALIVVGLGREARIAAPLGRVAIGAAGLLAAMRERPSALLSFGLCGALDRAFAVGDLLIADSVTAHGRHWSSEARLNDALRRALPDARRGIMAGGEVIVATPADKAALRRAGGAAAVDMESHAVARAAEEAGLPFAVVRAVSDRADQALPRAAQAGFKADGEPDVAAVIGALALHPWELPALLRTARDAEKAFKALARAAGALTPV